MTFWEILIIALVSLFVIGVIIKAVIDKKKGKGSCGCYCKDCPSKTACKNNKNK